jgi:hypothetical protein
MRKIVKDCGLEVLEFKPNFKSGYFFFSFSPFVENIPRMLQAIGWGQCS